MHLYFSDWIKKMKGLSKKQNKNSGTDYSLVISRGKGGGGRGKGEEDMEEINGDRRRLGLGCQTHNKIYR